ncbi:hypothetical protein V6N11_081121 [Hibiscus sabdariffa]|uniref:Uncharacterized protein n=1 Tax=Hibiscus sabdariffa TaxID=183260 RepID=A0ABR2QIX1_9ROSI
MQTSALPSAEEDTTSSLLIVMTMAAVEIQVLKPLQLYRGSTWIASHEAEEKQLHFEECMIQGLLENSMVRSGQKDFLKQKRCPMMAQSPRSAWIHARNDQPGRIRKQQYRSSEELY